MRTSTQTLLLSAALTINVFSPDTVHGEVVVRMETNLGDIDIQLHDQAAPITVNNFLNYVRSGRYNNTIIQRSQPGFVIQGGGYGLSSGFYTRVIADSAIVNEFDPTRSNVRGTIAMAKLDGNPDSATSEWFFNLADNSSNLDFQNGGFTVFGEVINDGMNTVDAIAALDIWNMSYLSPFYGGAFTAMPLIDFSAGDTFDPAQHHVHVYRVRETLNVVDNRALILNTAGNYFSLLAVAPATLANVRAITNPAPGSTPQNVTFREGFLEFEVRDVAPGGSVMVALQLPADYIPNTYYMYGPTPNNPTPHWYEFEFDGRTGAEFFGNNFVVLHFVDGERGDADLTVNGVIVDPGAPGIDTTPTSSSSGGGCSLASGSGTAHERLDAWLIGLLLFTLWLHSRTRSDRRISNPHPRHMR